MLREITDEVRRQGRHQLLAPLVLFFGVTFGLSLPQELVELDGLGVENELLLMLPKRSRARFTQHGKGDLSEGVSIVG